MNKHELIHKIAMSIQDDIEFKEGRSAGVNKDSVSIKIKDNNDKEFIITVKELI